MWIDIEKYKPFVCMCGAKCIDCNSEVYHGDSAYIHGEIGFDLLSDYYWICSNEKCGNHKFTCTGDMDYPDYVKFESN